MIKKSLVQKLSTNTIKEKRSSGLFFFLFFSFVVYYNGSVYNNSLYQNF